MKVILILALVMGAAVAWVDVDTVVAAYNVDAYRSGKLETVDVGYLSGLGYGAVPAIEKLTHSADTGVAQDAADALEDFAWQLRGEQDIRQWNIAAAIAWDICEEYGTWNP